VLTLSICALASLLLPSQLRVVVNIPAFRLDAFVDDSIVRTFPVAPGMPEFRTPRGSFAITSVEWNPWWIPPDSPWARKEKPQPPGPTNPMGRVKLNFRPLYFLHGTPFAGSIGTAASHGCVRLKNEHAIDLARLVHKFGTPALTELQVDTLAVDSVTTRLIELTEPIPLEVRYDLVEIRAGRVSVYRDVYGLGKRAIRDEVISALLGRGYETEFIDVTKVDALVKRIPQAGRSILLDSLLTQPRAEVP
jgi:murein L,D-transpeptidase YcbB/YkuD